MGGNELFVILEFSVIQKASDDLFAKRIEVGIIEVGQALQEEFLEDFRAGIVGLFPDLGLSVHLQEPAGDHATFDLQLMECVAEQRATGGTQLFGAKFCSAAASHVF